jgi:hypothetical protein
VYGIPPGQRLDSKLAEILDYFAKKAGGSFPAQISGALPALNSMPSYQYAVEEAHTLEASAVAKVIVTFGDKEYLTPENV